MEWQAEAVKVMNVEAVGGSGGSGGAGGGLRLATAADMDMS